MAEVTGSFGDQPIELNNAATEITQKQLLAAILSMAKSQKLNDKAQKELEQELEKLTKSAKKLKKSQEDAAKAADKEAKAAKEAAEQKKKETEAAEEHTKALTAATSGLDKLASTIGSTAIGMANLIDNLSQVGNSMTAAAGAMNAIPVVGGVLAAVFGAVANAADRSTKSFQAAASVGATFNGSIVEFKNSATTAGMTMEDFGKLVSENGESLRLLGGTTDGGAKRFARLSNGALKTSQDLYALGYSTEDVNQGLMNYTKFLGQSGKLGQQTDAQLIAGSKAYLKEMDLLAKVTGQTRKEQEDARAALLADAQFQAKIASMGEIPAKALANTIDGLSPSLRGIAKDIMVTGTATTEESKNFAAFMPKSTAMMQEFAKITENGGTITQQQQEQLRNLMSQEGEERKKQLQSVGKYNQEYAQSYMQVVDASNMQKDAIEKARQAQEAAANGTDGLNQKVEQFKQQLAGFSNEFMMALAQSGALDDLMSTFKKLAGFTTDFILPAFNFLTDHIWGIVGTMVALKAINAAVAIAQLAQLPGLAAMAMGLWAVVAPMMPFVLAVGAILGVFYLLKKAGWSVGDVFEAIKDNVYGFGLVLTETYLKIAKWVAKFFGGSEMVDTALEKVQAEREELKVREAARDQRRKERREEAAAKDAEVGATNKLVDAKKQELEVTKKSTVDYGDTISILKDQQQKITQPGATAAAPPALAMKGFGKVAAQFESGGNAGAISTGKGDFGGKSYGAFQLSSKTGDVDKFLKESGYGSQFAGMQVGSAEFDKKWKELAGSDSKFAEAQQQHAAKTHYLPQLEKLKKSGIDLSSKGSGVQEAIMSTANQYGASTDVIQKALGGKDISKMSDSDIINAIQDYKASSVQSRFKSSSPDVQKGVQKRIEQERLSLLGIEPGSTAAPTATQVAQVTPNAPLSNMDVIKQAQEKYKAEQEAKATGAGKPAGPTAPATTQESAESLLASLNTKMDQLIKLSAQTTTNTYKQVVATQGLSNNLYTSV